eukprot:1680-Heterococcus_DN1.PRE.8
MACCHAKDDASHARRSCWVIIAARVAIVTFADASEGHVGAVKGSKSKIIGSVPGYWLVRSDFRCAVQESWWNSAAAAACSDMGRKRAQRKKQQNNNLVQHRAPNLSYLLQRAKQGDAAQAVKEYLDVGGSANATIGCGQDAALQIPLLHYIALHNAHPHTELAESVKLLVKAGASINALAGPDGDDRTALMCACYRSCCTKTAQIFMQNGADVLVQSIANGTTALHITAAAGYSDNVGQQAIFKAAYYGYVPMMKFLAERGLSATAVDNRGQTVLMIAAARGHKSATDWLLQHGVVVNAALNESNTTALHFVSGNDSCDDAAMIELLLANGADVHKRSSNGRTALVTAASTGKLECVKQLIAAGADVMSADDIGFTSLSIAAATQCSAIVQLLTQHGATAVIDHVIHMACP